MRSDFDLIVHEICDKEIKIYPIADVHFGALEHNADAWTKFCTKVDAKEVLQKHLINR